MSNDASQPDIRQYVSPEALRFVQPQSAMEVDEIWDDFLAVAENFPHPVAPDFKDFLRQNPLACFLFYLGELPVAYIERHLYVEQDVVELHGVVRDGMERTGIAYHCLVTVMDDTYFNQNKPVVEVEFPVSNQQIAGFVQKWGFIPIENTKADHLRFRMTRREYVRQRELYEKEMKRRKKQDRAVRNRL